MKIILMIKVIVQDTVNKRNKITKNFCLKIFKKAWLKKAEIGIRIVSSEESQHLNKKYRKKNNPTNILSFLVTETPFLIGDLVICHDLVKIEAKAQYKKIGDHYTHLLLHGFLHLIGYDHTKKSEQKIMEDLEIEILMKLGIKNPYV